MKKILFVHRSLVCGGVENALLDLCSLLNKEKYEVTVLEYHGGNNVLRSQFVKAGIRVINPYDKLVPGRNIIRKAYNVIVQNYIEYKIMKRNKIKIKEDFDIIVYYQVTPLRVKCKSNPKIISYIHGDIETNQSYFKDVVAQQELICKSDKIVCVSDLVKKSLEHRLGITKNVITIFNPINSHKIMTLSEEKFFEDISKPYICAVGRLSVEKRFDKLVQIHKNLLEKGLEHDLVIVGEGSERSKIKHQIRQTETENSVHLVGFKENPYPYIKNSLFTVCSSYTEGLHIVSMESLLLGRPVVSSFPTVAELFGNEKCGLITDTDINSLEEGICKMLSNKKFYEECVLGAEKRSESFHLKKMINKVENVFEQIL